MSEKIQHVLMRSNPTQQAIKYSKIYREYYEEFIKEFGNTPTNIASLDIFVHFNIFSTIWFYLKNEIDAKKISDEIKNIIFAGKDNKNNISEMEARLILSHYGYNSYRVEESSNQRCPDIVALVNGKIVEIEVTKADIKKNKTDSEIICRNILNKIEIFPFKNIFIYINAPEIDINAVVKCVNQTHDIYENVQMCVIRYDDSNSEAKNLVSGIKSKIDKAFISVLRTTIPTGEKIEIIIEIAEKSYSNTVDDKFRNPQSTGKHPFIIFYDTSNLPNSYKILKEYILRKMSNNPKISGTLLYNIGYSPSFYPRLNKLAFFRNESAGHPQ